MNGPGDIPLTHSSSTPDTTPCSLISIIPTLGMSSCRGRAEAFARRLSSKLRTLGSQTDDDPISQEDEPIINGSSANTWMAPHESEQTVTDLQPLRHESDSFFDFDCELESPGSPVDECEYLRLIETASNTPHNSAAESGYVCASAASSHSSTDGPYFDVVSSDNPNGTQPLPRTKLAASELPEYVNALKLNGSATQLSNGHNDHDDEVNDEQISESNGLADVMPSNRTGDIKNALPAAEPEFADVSASEEETESEPKTEAKSEFKSSVKAKSETGPESEVKTAVKAKLETGPESEVKTAVKAKLETEPESEVKTAVKSKSETGPQRTPEISTQEMMVRVQDDIISELQKQSEQFADTTTTTPTPVPTPTPPPMPMPTTDNGHCYTSELSVVIPFEAELKTEIKIEPDSDSYTTASFANGTTLEVIHNICNTRSEDGEDVLKVEVTEIVADVADVKKEVETAPAESSTDETDVPKAESVISTDADIAVKLTAKAHLSALDTTDDEDDCRPQRVRRCSSLKTGKTPPGTPGRKKIVRFADVLGLDLADVKTFLDEIPTIPKSAFEDLEFMEAEPPIQLGPKSDKLLMPLFQQPGGLSTFLDLVREKQVSLENAAVTDHINQTITGSVRVRNLDFHKSVHIRYTLDGWRSYADLQANYVENSCDGFSDKFTFVIFGNSMQIGQRLEFAVRFQCKGQQFWDSNYDTNYCFQCLPTSTSIANPIQPIVPSHHTSSHMVGMLSPTAGDAWCSSFY